MWRCRSVFQTQLIIVCQLICGVDCNLPRIFLVTIWADITETQLLPIHWTIPKFLKQPWLSKIAAFQNLITNYKDIWSTVLTIIGQQATFKRTLKHIYVHVPVHAYGNVFCNLNTAVQIINIPWDINWLVTCSTSIWFNLLTWNLCIKVYFVKTLFSSM